MVTSNLLWIEAGRRGVDYSSPNAPTPSQLVAAGYTFVARYVQPSSPKMVKWLTPRELDALHAAGMGIIVVYESYAERPLRGLAAGRDDGETARRWCEGIGYPLDVAVLAAVDINTTSANAAAVLDYLRGFAVGVLPYAYGVYGDYDAIELVHRGSALNWQATARSWSAGRVHPATHIHQGNQSADHLTDDNRVLRRFVTWGPTIDVTPPPPPTPTPDPTPPANYHPEREPDMPTTPGMTAQMIRDSRYQVVLLVGAGTPEWLTEERVAALAATGVPMLVSKPHPSFEVLAARAGIGNPDQYPA